MSEANVALARRFFEDLWNGRRPELAADIIDEHGVCLSEGGAICGVPPFLEGTYEPFIAAFPDLRINIEGTVAQDDQVVVRWRAVGTHTGSAMGIAPSGRRIHFRGMSWLRCRDGKFIEGWDTWNMSGLLQAMRGGEAPPSLSIE